MKKFDTKTVKLFLVLTITLATSLFAGRTYANDEIRVIPQIAESRQEAMVLVKSNTGLDVTCESLEITVQLRDKAFGEPMGNSVFTFQNVYGDAKSSTGIKIDLKDINFDPAKTIIHNITSEHKNCRRASFKSYCEKATLTSTETQTVQKVLSYFGEKRCVDFDDQDANKVSLRGEGLVSLRPLVYLTELKRLYLQKNQIASIDDLKFLPQIELLEISKNPVADISTLAELRLLKELDIANTYISDLLPLKKLRYLKTLNMRNTKVTELAPLTEIPNLKKACTYENTVIDYDKNKKRIDELNEFCML
jgi:hypothetical protein